MSSASRDAVRDNDEGLNASEDQPLLSDSAQNHDNEQSQSKLATAWQSTVATLEIYRNAISERIRNSKSKQSAQETSQDGQGQHRTRWHPAWRATLLSISAIVLLLAALVGIESTHLFAFTLSSPSEAQQARILDEALILKGPDMVRLLNISDDGIQVRVDGRLGIDPDRALDVWLGERRKQSWWRRRDRSMVEWALSKVGGARVELGQLAISEPDWSLHLEEQTLDLIPTQNLSALSEESTPILTSAYKQPQRLLSFDVEPLLVPLPELLHSSSKDDNTHDDDPILGGNSSRRARLEMRPLNLTLLFKPLVPAPYMVELAERAVKHGNITLDIRVDSLSVKGVTKREIVSSGSSTSSASSSWIPGLIRLKQSDIIKRVRQGIPDMDSGNSTGEFLNLTRYDFFEIKEQNQGEDVSATSKALGIRAYAEAQNPLGQLLKGTVRYSLPFGIFLPVNDEPSVASKQLLPLKSNTSIETVLLAVVATDPIILDGQEKIQLQLQGRVVPPPTGGDDSADNSLRLVRQASQQHQHAFQASAADVSKTVKTFESPNEVALGNFLSRFLRGDPNTVYVRGGSPFEGPQDPKLPGNGSPDLPSWLNSMLGVLDVPISFPGSKVTDLIKNVTIQDLKIKTHPWSKDKLLFSGTILGELGLPAELSAVDVDIKYLWPDILVYDGKPPSLRHGGGGGDHDDDPPDDGGDDDDEDALTEKRSRFDGGDNDDDEAPPLPDPLPKGAFGRVRPHTWANATTTWDRTDPANPRKILRSELIDVPFSVLPGRGKEFRAFTWKLITGEGAETGIEGSSRVKIEASGLGELVISKLPVVGAFMVGKRGDDGDDSGLGDALARSDLSV